MNATAQPAITIKCASPDGRCRVELDLDESDNTVDFIYALARMRGALRVLSRRAAREEIERDLSSCPPIQAALVATGQMP